MFSESVGFGEGIINYTWEMVAKTKTENEQKVIAIHPNERNESLG